MKQILNKNLKPATVRDEMSVSERFSFVSLAVISIGICSLAGMVSELHAQVYVNQEYDSQAPTRQLTVPNRQATSLIRQSPLPIWRAKPQIQQSRYPIRQTPLPKKQVVRPIRQTSIPNWRTSPSNWKTLTPNRHTPAPIRQTPLTHQQTIAPIKQTPLPLPQSPLPVNQTAPTQKWVVQLLPLEPAADVAEPNETEMETVSFTKSAPQQKFHTNEYNVRSQHIEGESYFAEPGEYCNICETDDMCGTCGECNSCGTCGCNEKVWQLLPDGLMYKSYLAGEKEPRFQSTWLYEQGRGWLWEPSVGGRIGLIRHGTRGAVRPQGWQLDVEGAAFPRFDMQHASQMDSVDIRAGIISTWRCGPTAFKAGYYHISSHVGDEFMIRNPGFTRIEYVRDSSIFGITHNLTCDFSIYGEVGYDFGVQGGAKPLEFQFGAQYSPACYNGMKGKPFAAVNGHLREDFNFDGNINVVAGWQWRGEESDRLFRIGLQYYNGKALQYQFFDKDEELMGLGMWFDY